MDTFKELETYMGKLGDSVDEFYNRENSKTAKSNHAVQGRKFLQKIKELAQELRVELNEENKKLKLKDPTSVKKGKKGKKGAGKGKNSNKKGKKGKKTSPKSKKNKKIDSDDEDSNKDSDDDNDDKQQNDSDSDSDSD